MTTPVVIVGGGINGLGVARSLNTSFNLHLIDSNHQCPAARSKYVQFHCVKSTKCRQLIDELLSLRKRFKQNPVLIITEEKAVYYVSKYRELLTKFYCFLMPEHELVDQLLDKNAFYELALKTKAPVPKTIMIDSAQDLNNIDDLSFPCAFKPHEQNAAYAKSFRKAYKVFSAQEVVELYKEISPVLKKMILQEWIEGEDSDIYFTLSYIGKSGDVISAFTGRKIRSWPVNVGGTASCTNAPEVAKTLESISHEFCHKLQYRGLIGIEYKRNQRDGNFLMIEPTVARTDFQHEIASLSGCRLLESLAFDLSNQAIPKSTPTAKSIVWKESISEAMAINESGNSDYPDNANIYSALFRLSDPMPYLVRLAARVKNKFFA